MNEQKSIHYYSVMSLNSKVSNKPISTYLYEQLLNEEESINENITRVSTNGREYLQIGIVLLL